MTRIHLSPPDVTDAERQALLAAFDSGWIAPVGPALGELEARVGELTGTGHAAALASGTAALHLALLACGAEPGADVLVPTLTFAATVNAVTYTGATPVLVDSERTSWNIDVDLVAEELDRRARERALPAAVVAVDLYGQCADLVRLQEVCDAHGVPLVEDAAEALGATCGGRPAGSFGSAAALSFNGNKLVTTGGGGALVSRDPAVVERARYLATQARQPLAHYEHTDVGFNYRLSNLLAAIGVAQLDRLPQLVAARAAHRQAYEEALAAVPGVTFAPVAPWGRPNWWLTCIRIDPGRAAADREAVRLHLERHDVEARPVWKPMHQQPVFRDLRLVGGAVADAVFADGLCLPSGSAMTAPQRDRVIGALLEVLDA